MLESKVEAFLKRHAFTMKNAGIVVGVSGGPDSLALLHYLLQKRRKENLALVAAHVDHMFRGQESYEDAMFVKEFCKQEQVPFEMVRVNVPKVMEETGQSAELAGREVRYEFYQKIMEKYQFKFLALGHHGDDQIETILMRLTRGSTGMARTGIPFTRSFQNGVIFRPFLGVTKVEIEDYCKRQHLSPRIDPSNAESIYSRNRFRKEVLPFLKRENPHVHEHFQRFSENLQEDEAFLEELTVREMNTVMTSREEGKITIDITRLLKVPLPLQRRGIQLILNYLYKVKPVSLSAVHIDQVFHLIQQGEPSGRLDFPNGLKVNRSYFEITFQFKQEEAEPYLFELNGPGKINLPGGDTILMETITGEIPFMHQNSAIFAEKSVNWPLIVRTRKQGDRMTLKGMNGTRKLKDIFIDHKIPIHKRDTWPVITDKNGCVLWLPGLKKSALEGKDRSAQQYILLTYES
ncbi:tRNA lysidine(34) synthetase TilS [Bacillus sp. BRMEA1]|uniref:tRNA lysidine(34) synthetase TilS n=1 Tax=Neobacillus endophyticus TaxID=2738405 RepID=UPI001564606F|nr:tRNA lysidine(34) synthetase TilS [Neobacillus endophyticus]NRD77485.1 tRNA lysidine(34) synthetase TilS [Neobacillus endophyticus]